MKSRTPFRSLAIVLLVLHSPVLAVGQAAEKLPAIEKRTEAMERIDGFIPFYWDSTSGDLWLEVERLGEPFLYFSALSAGLGSNDIGLDRGLLGPQYVVRFERTGLRLLLVASNQGYRARSENVFERLAVRDAFAESVLWGFTIEAETAGRVLVKASDFLLNDAMNVAARLKGAGQGTYARDSARSAPYRPGIKAFPRNSEMEARLTFTSSTPGAHLAAVAPDARSITIRQRLSFVALPDPGFEPRPFDPRSGYSPVSFVDYAQPVSEQKEIRYLIRHRLQKRNPELALSEAVEPIVYYLDRGTPEPIRRALLEGASWWNQAFEAAGFVDAFRVEMLPEGADPLDVRYNVIQWVHRSTRGWSYGRSIVDPRTGEIIKGHVSLGSLRVRQDYMLAEGLIAPYEGDRAGAYPPEEDPMLALALARLRQLSAHEVGHTLGLVHNFAASTVDRSSVMDYPAPLVSLDGEGKIDLSAAYDRGIGEWDEVAIRFGYSEFLPGADEPAELNAILSEAAQNGLALFSDDDARPRGSAHPAAHLWDNGRDPVAALETQMAVRRTALEAFGENNVRVGRPLATLHEVLVPLYLNHRYQLEATAKLVGGVDYTHRVRGDLGPPTRPVTGVAQREALDGLLKALQPEALRVPEAVRASIGSRPPGFSATRELFSGHTAPMFDTHAPAAVVADLVVGLIVEPERAARLVYQHDFDSTLPGLIEILQRTDDALFSPVASSDAYDEELTRIVQQTWVSHLMRLETDRSGAPGVRARVRHVLRAIHDRLNAQRVADVEEQAHRRFLVDEIERHLARDVSAFPLHHPVAPPPGAPIGSLRYGDVRTPSLVRDLDVRDLGCGLSH